MWYDRIVVGGPLPWYWIVAISIFAMAVVCGLLLCACNHKTEWKNTFNDLFLKAAHHDKEHRDRIRDITSKKNFGPSKALVHRFAKADLQSDRMVLPPDPRLTSEQVRRAGLDSTYTSSVSTSIVYPTGGKQVNMVTSKKEHSSREPPIWKNCDQFNGNIDLPNMPLRAGGIPEEEPIEMSSLPDSRQLSTDENHYSPVDSASLVTAYLEEFTVPAAKPQKDMEKFGDNGADISPHDKNVGRREIDGSEYGGYENKEAMLQRDDMGIAAQSDLVQGTLHDYTGALTSHSRLASKATTLNRGSVDSTRLSKPLLAKQHFSDDFERASYENFGSEIETSDLPPIDSNSSLSSSIRAPNKQSNDFIPVNKVVGIGPPPSSETNRSWVSSVVKDRPASGRTRWSDETSSNSVESDIALENCDYSSDTSESYPPKT